MNKLMILVMLAALTAAQPAGCGGLLKLPGESCASSDECTATLICGQPFFGTVSDVPIFCGCVMPDGSGYCLRPCSTVLCSR